MGFDERAAAGATTTRARLHTASAIKPFHRALCMLVCSLTLLRVVHSAVVALFALSLSATRRSGSRPTVATWPGKGVRCLLILLTLVGTASAQPAASVQVPASVQCAGNCSTNASTPLLVVSAAHDELLLRSRVARRLTVINVAPGVNLQTVVDGASAGDEIVLADGTYTGAGTTSTDNTLVDSGSTNNMIHINKDITIRALNTGQAVLDGQNSRRVVYVAGGTVALQGLSITGGYYSVRGHFLELHLRHYPA